MIRVTISQRRGHTSIETRGHGNALVCAAVSGVMQTLGAGLVELAKAYPKDLQVIVNAKRRS